MKNLLAIIPARGGSKRLKNKNILKLNNIPLIAYSIKSAINSKYLDDVYVTSEDKTILRISKKYGAKIIKRKKEYASDTSATHLALIEVIKKLKRIGKNYKYLVLLQPTSPLRTTKNINDAVKLFLKKKTKALVSVAIVSHSPLWSFKAKNNLNLANIFNKIYFKQRSQDLPQFYMLNGAIYIVDIKYYLKYKTTLLKRRIIGFRMNEVNSIDIDDMIDFKLCEVLIKEKIWRK